METLTAPAAPASVPLVRQAKKPENKAAMEAAKRAKILRGWVVKANKAYKLIEPGDRVMVCLSGGKDSFALLEFLLSLQRAKQPEFDLIAVNLDQKQPGFPAHVLPAYLSAKGVPFEIVEQDTYSVVKRLIPEGNTTCSLCSRLRRGALYAAADRLGCNKIALGHHRDDVLQTFFLNLFYHGRLKTMPPKLVSDDGRHTVIRPLVFCKEADLELYAEDQQFPIIPCDLCGSQPDLQRAAVKAWLRQWDKSIPGRNDNIFHALQEVVPSHLFDTNLFDFAGLKADGQARHAAFEGDHGFS